MCSPQSVQRIHLIWPSEMFNLASFRVIFDHFTQLQELIMEFPGNMVLTDMGAHLTDFLTVGKILSSRGVACCMTDTDTVAKGYICPTADLVRRTSQPSHSIANFMYFCGCIHQESLKELGKMTQLMTSNKCAFISIRRDPGDNKELSEEDVAAANYILDLVANSRRRGKLDSMTLPKVDITDADWLTVYLHGTVL